jgi:1-acyl-sn-glycerol-3-phosphate acyltransferase
MAAVANTAVLNGLERAAGYAYFALAHGFRWFRAENVPRSGPAIVVANHQSYYDPVLITLAANRHVVYLAWEYLYNKPILGDLMRFYGAIPVDPDRPSPAALARMLAALRSGEVCGIFPEGGRTADGLIAEPRPGAALLALKSGAPVVPVTVCGADRVWPVDSLLPVPGPVRLCFGRPLHVTGSAGRPERRELVRFTYEAMLRVADGFAVLGRPGLARRCRERLEELRSRA